MLKLLKLNREKTKGGVLLFVMLTFILNMSFLGVFFVIPSTVTASEPYIEPNPELEKTCGVDVALIIDSSGSIDVDELREMQDAFIDYFVGAFNDLFMCLADRIRIQSERRKRHHKISVT